MADLLVLSAGDVEKITASFLPLELQVLMAQVFSSLSQFSEGHQAKSSNGAAPPKSLSEPHPTTQTPHRTSIAMENHTALFMPARLSIQPLQGNPGDQTGSTSIKIVSVPRSRGQSGLPATTVVLDEYTGAVKAIVNARKLTALRNAAGSLLSTILVATRYPRRIVAFGAGAQIEAHLHLHLKSFTNVQHVTVINRTFNSRATRLLQHLASTFPNTQFVLHTPADGQTRSWNIDGDSLDVQSPSKEESQASTTAVHDSTTGSPRRSKTEGSLRRADLVICATSSTEPLFPSHWVGNNTHIILIGSYTPNMHEIDSSLVRRSLPLLSQPRDSKTEDYLEDDLRNEPILLVDSRWACSQEAGELIEAQVAPDKMVEIGELLSSSPLSNIPGQLADLNRLKTTREASTPNHEDEASDIRATLGDAEEGTNYWHGPVTIFKSVGVGLQDVMIAKAVVDKAETLGLGQRIVDYDSM